MEVFLQADNYIEPVASRKEQAKIRNDLIRKNLKRVVDTFRIESMNMMVAELYDIVLQDDYIVMPYRIEMNDKFIIVRNLLNQNVTMEGLREPLTDLLCVLLKWSVVREDKSYQMALKEISSRDFPGTLLPSSYFTGRKKELETIKTRFKDHRKPIILHGQKQCHDGGVSRGCRSRFRASRGCCWGCLSNKIQFWDHKPQCEKNVSPC